MLEIVKLDFEGEQHFGIDDAFNQAKVAIQLLKSGYAFVSTQLETLKKTHLPSSKDLLPIEFIIHLEFDTSKNKDDTQQH